MNLAFMDNTIQLKSRKKISKPMIKVIVISAVTSAVIGAFFGFIAGSGANLLNLKGRIEGQKIEVKERSLIEEDGAVTEAVKNTSPAVVSIVITKDVPKFRSFFDSPFDDFDIFSPFGGSEETEKQQIGGGSGFFVSRDGMIVTNRHVVEDTSADYTVITGNGKEYEAKVLAIHPIHDLAIIEIKEDNTQALNIGNSDELEVGQTVIAIGNSLGEFSNTVSKGIISGLGRSLTASSGFGQSERLSNIIQTDAAINPGNSGGPLIDINGDAIGVNVAMAQGAENIGFAIPVNQVKKMIDEVKTKGKISVPFLGVRYILINEAIKEVNNLPYDYGALVIKGERITDLAVVPGSPADKAGIVENDIILEMSGEKISDKNPLGDYIAKYNVGDEASLKIWRKGEEKEIKVKLEERE